MRAASGKIIFNENISVFLFRLLIGNNVPRQNKESNDIKIVTKWLQNDYQNGCKIIIKSLFDQSRFILRSF